MNRYISHTNHLLPLFRKYIRSFSLFFIVVIFTGYSYLNATNNDKIGDWIYPVLLIVGIFRLLCISELPTIHSRNKILIFFFGTYLLMALVSVLYPLSQYSDPRWFHNVFSRFTFATGILLSIGKVDSFDRKVLRWGLFVLCLSFAMIAIFVSVGFIDKGKLHYVTPFSIVNFEWNDKYYSFWLVFLTWAAVSFLWKFTIFTTICSIALILFSFVVVFNTTSESSQLAMGIGSAIFIVSQIKIFKNRLIIFFSLSSLMIIIPLLWVISSSIITLDINSISQISFLKTRAIISRLYLYSYCSELVNQNMFLGYGFGSTLHLPLPAEGLFEWKNRLPGGHPHNVVFLFLLEHGIIGIFWSGALLVSVYKYVLKININYPGFPAILALLFSAQIIFSLSFSIWQADVVLILMMFFYLLFITTDRDV